MINIKVKCLPGSEDLDLPTYATTHSAGVDLIAANYDDITITPGQRALIKTAIAIELPAGFEAQIRPRSGLALKHGITVLNSPGTIDADYRGEIGVILINLGQNNFTVVRGMRIAQMIIAPYIQAQLTREDELAQTVRGDSGFGSTGIKKVLADAVS